MERLNRNRKRVDYTVGIVCVSCFIGIFIGLNMWIWIGSKGWQLALTSFIVLIFTMLVSSLLKRMYDDIEKESTKRDPKPPRKSKFEERLDAYLDAKNTSN